MNKVVRVAFSRLLRESRESKGLSQDKIAKMLGVSQNAYAQFEAGACAPNLEILFDLHEILGIELSDLKNKLSS